MRESGTMFQRFFRLLLMVAMVVFAVSCNRPNGVKGENSDVGSENGNDQLASSPSPDDVVVGVDGIASLKGREEPYTGTVIQRDKSQKVRYFGFYMDGQLHGAEMRWYPSGLLKRSYDYERGEKIRHREWFENGNRKIDAMMKDGVALGRHVKWFEDGRERFVGNFLEGLIWHGHIKDVAEDGTVLWDAVFENGRYVSGVYPENEKQNLIDAGLIDAE